MQLRLCDQNAQVRSAAVDALWRLHDPTDKNDEVTQALLLTLAEDPCKHVRQAVLVKLEVRRACFVAGASAAVQHNRCSDAGGGLP